MTKIQGGNQTCDLVNDLPYSNQLSCKSFGNSVDEFEYLRLSCQGSSQASMFGGVGECGER